MSSGAKALGPPGHHGAGPHGVPRVGVQVGIRVFPAVLLTMPVEEGSHLHPRKPHCAHWLPAPDPISTTSCSFWPCSPAPPGTTRSPRPWTPRRICAVGASALFTRRERSLQAARPPTQVHRQLQGQGLGTGWPKALSSRPQGSSPTPTLRAEEGRRGSPWEAVRAPGPG